MRRCRRPTRTRRCAGCCRPRHLTGNPKFINRFPLCAGAGARRERGAAQDVADRAAQLAGRHAERRCVGQGGNRADSLMEACLTATTVHRSSSAGPATDCYSYDAFLSLRLYGTPAGKLAIHGSIVIECRWILLLPREIGLLTCCM